MRRFQVYDTRTRETRLFEPIAPPRVGMFVCGLTPYDRGRTSGTAASRSSSTWSRGPCDPGGTGCSTSRT